MTTTVYLIRHGETLWNKSGRIQGCTDIDLSPVGIEQAHKMAKRMQGKFDIVYSSPLNRAFETAQILCEGTDITPIKHNGIKEINFGSWEGLTFPQVAETYPDAYSNWKVDKEEGRMLDGEVSIRNASIRSKEAIYDIVNRNQGKHIALVSHGGLIKSAILGLFELDMTMYHKFVIGNTGITIINFDNNLNPRLITLNDDSHVSDAVTYV